LYLAGLYDHAKQILCKLYKSSALIIFVFNFDVDNGSDLLNLDRYFGFGSTEHYENDVRNDADEHAVFQWKKQAQEERDQHEYQISFCGQPNKRVNCH